MMKSIRYMTGILAIAATEVVGFAGITTDTLVYHCTLDSADAIVNPVKGSGGQTWNATFEAGHVGSALLVPAGTGVASIPFDDGLPQEKGCIDFWAKIKASSPNFTWGGNPRFFNFFRVGTSDTSFSFLELNANDGGGKSGWHFHHGSVAESSCPTLGQSSYATVFNGADYTAWHHYKLKWNTKGLALDKTKFIDVSVDGVSVVSCALQGVNTEAFKTSLSGKCELYLSLQEERSLETDNRVPYLVDEFKVWNTDTPTAEDKPVRGVVDVEGFGTISIFRTNEIIQVEQIKLAQEGDVLLPSEVDAEPVAIYARGCFGGSPDVTGVSVPAGVSLDAGAVSGCANLTNITLATGADMIGLADFRGCSSLREIVIPKDVPINERSFKDCWKLERVVFCGAPLLDGEASSFGSLFEMADMICYPENCAVQWEKVIGNIGYRGKYGQYAGTWNGVESLINDTGNLSPVEPPVITNFVYTTVTNEIHKTLEVTNIIHTASEVTNVIHTASEVTNVVIYVEPLPEHQPAANYFATSGKQTSMIVEGAVGWDVLGLPEGMVWDPATGILSGSAYKSGNYDLFLVSGSGASTKMMRTTLNIAGLDPVVGYVGVDFHQTGMPFNRLADYKKIPNGLKWTATSETLSGVPSKAGDYSQSTIDGEPIIFRIDSLPLDAIGTFNGMATDPISVMEPLLNIRANVILTTTTAGKITANVRTAEKTYSFTGKSWQKYDGKDTLTAILTLKTGEKFELTVHMSNGGTFEGILTGGVFGEGCTCSGRRDIYAKSGSQWIDANAHAKMKTCAGTYLFSFTERDLKDNLQVFTSVRGWTLTQSTTQDAAYMKLVLKETGVATITGTLPSTTKISCTATAHISADSPLSFSVQTIVFPKKTISIPITLELAPDSVAGGFPQPCGELLELR